MFLLTHMWWVQECIISLRSLAIYKKILNSVQNNEHFSVVTLAFEFHRFLKKIKCKIYCLVIYLLVDKHCLYLKGYCTQPKLSIFCAHSENYGNFFEKKKYFEANFQRNSKSVNFSRSSGSWVIDQNWQNIVLINNSKNAWTTWIIVMPFLSFSDNLIQDANIIFLKKKMLIMLR